MSVEINRPNRNNVVISKNNVQNVSVAGGIKGDKGETGPQGPRQYVAPTPPPNPFVGDQWLNSVTARQYVYLDDTWVEIGAAFQGPVGPTGPVGPIGVQGLQGPAGPGVVEGGIVGSLLRKASELDYQTEWITPEDLGSALAVSPAGNSTTIRTNTSQTSSTNSQVIDTTEALAIKYVVHASTETASEVTEILATANGDDVSHVEYGRISLGSDLASYDVQLSGGLLQLRATPASSAEITYVVSKQILS